MGLMGPGPKRSIYKKTPGKVHRGANHPAHKPAAKNVLSPAARAELARLRTIQTNQYGAPGDQNVLKRIARKVAGGQINAGQGEYRVRQGRATRDPQALRAGKTVQAELNPQIAGAKNYEAGLKVLYANLANNEGAAAQMMQGAQSKSRAAVGANYDNLASSIANNFKASQDTSQTELQRLGINMGDTSQAAEQQSRLANLAAGGRANALSTADVQGQGANQLMSLLQGESAATGAGLSAASAQQRGQLEASRPGKVYSLWQNLADAARADAAERQQQKFLNRITRAKFGVDADYKQAQSLSALASARKSVVASNKPRVVRKKVKPNYGG